jgi:hypothetical protein
MKRPTLPFTRRSFALLPLLVPLACLGCGGEGVSVNIKAGEKRRRSVEDLQKRADVKRKSASKPGP